MAFGAAAAITLIGGALRFATLSTTIWWDESVTIREVSGSFSQMLHRVVNHEASPPFYFICLWIWRHLFGNSAVEMRTLSALAGTVTIPLAFAAARTRLGTRAAIVLAACVAASPSLIYYSTELRMYGLLVLLCGVAFWAFLSAFEAPTARNLSVWAVASILALWTHYYAALAVAPQAAALLIAAWRRRGDRRPVLLAVGSVILAGGPLLYLISYQGHRAWAYGAALIDTRWEHIPMSLHYSSSALSVADQVILGPGGPAKLVLPLVCLLIGAIALALVVLRRHAAGLRHATLALRLVLPALVAVDILLRLQVIEEGRYLLALWLPVGFVVAHALSASGRAGSILTAALICVWLGSWAVSVGVPTYGPRDDTRGAARALDTARVERLIAIDEPWDLTSLELYRPEASASTAPVVRVSELDVIAMPIGGEPFPAYHPRPATPSLKGLPSALRLTKIIAGSTFVVERFVARSPVSIRVETRGSAFTAPGWRFLVEPSGAQMGGL
jgi:Dolichyl-phosphate-mannose-protein mannosyltransferase